MLDEATQTRLAAVPMFGRIGRPGEVADAVAFLVSRRRHSSPVQNSSSTVDNACRSDEHKAVGRHHRRRTGWPGAGNLLSRAGFRDFTIFDREDGVGGTWRINTYPGLACDVKSHLYSYSFDLNAHWSRLWSPTARDPGVLRTVRRQVRSAAAPEAAHRNPFGPLGRRQPAVVPDHLGPVKSAVSISWCSAVGLFTRPVFPDLVEQEPFTGTVMHSSRVGSTRSLLEGARVAVLGTGSTASQLIPEMAKVAAQVYSVQRSRPGYCPSRTGIYPQREHWVFARMPLAKSCTGPAVAAQRSQHLGDRARQ